MINKTFIFLLLITRTCYLPGQQKTLSFEHLTIENGLPENNPRCIIQDKMGYIWVGTQNGLVRYDGYSTRVYKLVTSKPEGSGKEQISCLYSDSKGTVWVGMRYDGLFRYNRGTDNFSQIKADAEAENLMANGEVQHIVEDKKGHIWIASYDYKKKLYRLAHYNSINGSFIHVSRNAKKEYQPPTNAIYCVFKDAGERIWIGTENGLYMYDEGAEIFKRFLASSDCTVQRTITGIYEAPSEPGILWLKGKNTCTGKGSGLVRFDAKNNSTTSYLHNSNNAESLLYDSVLTVLEDFKKRLWIGTSKGLSLFNRTTRKFTNYIPKDSDTEIDANRITVIQDDQSGNLWMAGGKGLLCFHTTTAQFTRYVAEEERLDGLPTNNISDIFIDAGGSIWLTTSKAGLHKINKQRSIFTQFKKIIGQSQSYPGGNAVCFVQDRDNTFWLATDKGLVHWYPLTDKFVKMPLNKSTKESGNIITTIALDKDGKIWWGDLQKGLYCYNPANGATSNYQNRKDHTTSLSNNYVRTILADKSGTIWVGTFGGGLCKLDKETGTFTRYPYAHSGDVPTNKQLDDSLVATVYEDKKGMLWIGTAQGGLNRLDRNTGLFTSYHDSKKGFEFITGIQEDGSGRFWISSFLYGLHLFNRETGTSRRFTEKEGLLCDVIQNFVQDKSGDLWITSVRGLSRLNTKSFSFSNYTKAQGLPESNLSRGILLTSKDQLLVGCLGGFLSFFPANIIPNRIPPFINIESISCINPITGKKKIILASSDKKINLGFNEKQITFHFTALHFNNPTLNRYAYMLEGYDNDWVEAGTQHSATYTNLSPGTYTFYVKAANSDGVWTKLPASLLVTINPPWWATWWAYLLFLLTAGIIAWGGYKIYRSTQLKIENRRLEEKVLQRTKELKLSLEELRETQTQLVQREKMASLGELAAGIAHEIQNPLNFVNNFSEVNKELIDEMQDALQHDDKEEAGAIASDIKDNLQKIHHHGKRADSIVKGMLQHSRASTGKKELTDINALADEYLRLSYHGLRAKDKDFNANFTTHFDESIGKIKVAPQDIGRVLLNLYNNAFYAVNERKKLLNGAFEPTVSVSTKRVGNKVEISVKDNGIGIPQKVVDKIYQPFFTTKPTGEGTGLGLSLSYDIITKAHGGEMKVTTVEGEGSEFSVKLPIS